MFPFQIFGFRYAIPHSNGVLNTWILRGWVCAAVLAAAMTLPALDFKVSVHDDAFDPAHLAIRTGDRVIWINEGSRPLTIQSGTGCVFDAEWNSGTFGPGAIYSRVFIQPGSYPYFSGNQCFLGLEGTVTIDETPEISCGASASPLKGSVPLQVTFGTKVSGGNPPYLYAWDFGDGFSGLEVAVWNTYSIVGTYAWRLAVSDSLGNTCVQDGIVKAEP